MKSLRIGDFDREIVIQSPTLTTNSAYESKTPATWATFISCWAQYRPIAATAIAEKFMADAARARETAVFTVRYVAGVTAAMRITMDGKVYNIRSTNDSGLARQTVLEIVAEAET